MGKVRKIVMGDLEAEEAQKKKADVRREAKKVKKQKIDGVGMKGGERTPVVEGTEIKSEYKKLIDEAESDSTAPKKKEKSSQGKSKTRSKRYLKIMSMVDKKKNYLLADAVSLIKNTSMTKFDGTVEIHINVNPNTLETSKKDNQKDIRGTVSLPHGTGKTIRVGVADEALIADVEKGKIEFDVLVATPSMMPKLAKVARVLGPKGLMPNPKNGTVTENIDKKVKELSAGQVNYKSEPNNPIIHMAVGKISFDDRKLVENISMVLDTIGRGKIARATVSSTMGPGIKIQL